MVAEKASPENAMEARIAHLESDVKNISANVAEIRLDLRGFRDKLDSSFTRLDEKIDGLFTHLDGKVGALDTKGDSSIPRLHANIARSFAHLDSTIARTVGELRGYCVAQFSAIDGKFERVFDSIASAKIWALTLYIALAVAMFGTMARGFGWL